MNNIREIDSFVAPAVHPFMRQNDLSYHAASHASDSCSCLEASESCQPWILARLAEAFHFAHGWPPPLPRHSPPYPGHQPPPQPQLLAHRQPANERVARMGPTHTLTRSFTASLESSVFKTPSPNISYMRAAVAGPTPGNTPPPKYLRGNGTSLVKI